MFSQLFPSERPVIIQPPRRKSKKIATPATPKIRSIDGRPSSPTRRKPINMKTMESKRAKVRAMNARTGESLLVR
jgi:hypothetical protein